MAYVPSVFHRFNPFWPDPEPFLSEYHGTIRISRAGNYRFFTSSQDCSFLQIDGRLVVAAPGWHGPIHDSRLKGEVNLSAGTHDFQYLHAAAGGDACMVAAWQPPGSVKPEAIPPAAFGSEAIAFYPTIPVKHSREYSVEIAGEVPLADSDLPLVRVQFRTVAARSSASRPKLHWDFGDGQTSTLSDPVHIYLSPGLYKVTMKSSGESEALAVVNRVPIHRALVFADESHPPDQLAHYLPILDKYDAATLDARSLLQLVRAFDQAGLPARAVKAGQAGILAEREPMDSDSALAVVRLVGGLLRDRIDDPTAALGFWQGAVKALRPESWKAECEIEAADLSLNELLQAEPAKKWLDSAAATPWAGGEPALTSRLNRVLGDWHARKGDKAIGPGRLRPGDDRAGLTKIGRRARRLARCTEPIDRGISPQQSTRSGVGRAPQVAGGIPDRQGGRLPYSSPGAVLGCTLPVAPGDRPGGDLVAINPDSPYADRLVYLAAECEERQGHGDRARAGYQSFVTDYPGSPLVGDARKKIAQLTRGNMEGQIASRCGTRFQSYLVGAGRNSSVTRSESCPTPWSRR